MSSERCLTTSRGVVVFSIYDYLKEIGIRPALWDKDHVNRINRFMDWDDVVRSVVPYFDELPTKEKQELNLEMIKLWKNITNLLMRTIKIKNSGDPKYRPYRYAHHMEFYLNNRGISLAEVGTPEEFQENDEIGRKHSEKRKKLKARKEKKILKNMVDQVEQDNSNNILPDVSSYDPMLFCETTTRDLNTTEHVYDYPVYDSNSFESDYEEEDPDQDFYDSIKPFLTKLDRAQMLDFKIEFLQILKKYQSQNA
ncbi:uncharacterized protein LOC119600289 [Lucilia sericata]|uniref:uncharacterized protein LOC119600289 n=1 Tax=Lucilia sericata TaxID=13632 RepID=UPI0018A7FEAE|nr:uncharacterized protein LOC119600289 [Lucilia sericata]